MKLNVWFILFTVAIAILIFRECTRPDTDPTIVIQDTIIFGDSEPYLVEIAMPIPKPYKVVEPSDTFFKDVDSAAILDSCMKIAFDYYSKKFYDETLLDDSSAFINLQAHTFRNQLYIDSLKFQNRRPALIRRTTYVYPDQKLQLYPGLGIGRAPNEFDLAANLLLITKNKLAFSASYGLMSKDVYFTVFYKPGKRKARAVD